MKSLYLLLILVSAFELQGKDYYLIYLGGQSNMDGFGYVRDLPDHLQTEMPGVYIYHGNPAPDDLEQAAGQGVWSVLQPGHGTGFGYENGENQYSDRFGVELSFIHELKQQLPDANFAVIKYSRGGTSIDSLAAGDFGTWEPDFRGKTGINQYDHFLNTLYEALNIRDIDGDGEMDRLIPLGIIWMQGESDAAYTEDIALGYYQNLKRLMDLIRAALRSDDLPVVIGKISDSWKDQSDGKVWDYGELVQHAQEKFVRTDPKAAIVRTTRYYQYSDPWHYDSKGYMELGKEFARALVKLL